jgi:hypothetical protein
MVGAGGAWTNVFVLMLSSKVAREKFLQRA